MSEKRRLERFCYSLIAALYMSYYEAKPVEAGQRTTATYYADYFNGRKMANGRPYNPGALTAAHPSMKLGSRVRVTNIKTGRSVVVTITDRCRCTIDLSKAAFRRLAPLKLGRIPVRIKRL